MHKHRKAITDNFTISNKMQMHNKDDACLVLSQALILQLKYAKHDLCKYLQALILQLKHVPLSPGSHSIYTGSPYNYSHIKPTA
ncbi:uncharacterized protein DS421_20g694690 [Arachis hypogaea]|nr:uncharacterized protein DS421_20g694690 [Arachis hypogaea]